VKNGTTALARTIVVGSENKGLSLRLGLWERSERTELVRKEVSGRKARAACWRRRS
jgi:hypothetical protein